MTWAGLWLICSSGGLSGVGKIPAPRNRKAVGDAGGGLKQAAEFSTVYCNIREMQIKIWKQ